MHSEGRNFEPYLPCSRVTTHPFRYCSPSDVAPDGQRNREAWFGSQWTACMANHSREQCPVLALGLTMENHLDWQFFS